MIDNAFVYFDVSGCQIRPKADLACV